MVRSVTTILLVVAMVPVTLAQSTSATAGTARQVDIEQTLRGLSDQWAKVECAPPIGEFFS